MLCVTEIDEDIVNLTVRFWDSDFYGFAAEDLQDNAIKEKLQARISFHVPFDISFRHFNIASGLEINDHPVRVEMICIPSLSIANK
jgi:hypothetical protein